MALYPTFEVPMVQDVEQQETKQVTSMLYDIKIGDFDTTSGGIINASNKYTAWAQWCLKAAQTERYAHLGYSQNYGVELEAAMKEPTKAARESAIERTITEALLADPYGRTLYVRNFQFAWGIDSVEVTFDVGHIDQFETEMHIQI